MYKQGLLIYYGLINMLSRKFKKFLRTINQKTSDQEEKQKIPPVLAMEEKQSKFVRFMRGPGFKNNSEFIIDFWNRSTSASIFTFPPGSGKTTNLLTLQHFFDKGLAPDCLFENMGISKDYMKLR